ncbi:DUF805 domain-containing protein [Marinobacter mobilis]|uniref:Uncharacterized membrane protein YhaH, DUF805 family n=1 Tax=Marinobacter mobilis TaxID=488533 RepID=A0A1H3C4D4_9GAMM|nr:DUF805 domain-containing protein [Marinobacter mobilis]SDX01268.1 Uncharacterized membrane protein YhaH, DUF805 family [Marinobacter mobilis]SDX48935.1 Uncharacterized membrane protein YhaH, DUF805 family [Marinobacter mobilis]
MNWYLEVMKKYAVFTGRAQRAEYWMFFLFNFIIAFALGFIEGLVGSPGILGLLYSLAVLIPGIAVSVRRLHDTDRSGWWLLIGFIPLIGAIVLLVFLVQDSKPGENQFGANPKGV